MCLGFVSKVKFLKSQARTRKVLKSFPCIMKVGLLQLLNGLPFVTRALSGLRGLTFPFKNLSSVMDECLVKLVM